MGKCCPPRPGTFLGSPEPTPASLRRQGGWARLRSEARGPPDLRRDFGRAPRQDVSGAPPGKRLLEGASNLAPVFSALWGERLTSSKHRVARGVPASPSNSRDSPSGRASKWAGRSPGPDQAQTSLSREILSVGGVQKGFLTRDRAGGGGGGRQTFPARSRKWAGSFGRGLAALSRACVAIFGGAEPRFWRFSREIRWICAGRTLRRVEVVGVTCPLLACSPAGPCPARPNHAVCSRPACRRRSPPQLQHFGPGMRGFQPSGELRGGACIPRSRRFSTRKAHPGHQGLPDILCGKPGRGAEPGQVSS